MDEGLGIITVTIIFDRTFKNHEFCLRLEENGKVSFVEMPGVVTLPDARKEASKLGYENCEFYEIRN